MSETTPEASGSQPASTTRTSGRARHKSQRALESEDTKRLIASASKEVAADSKPKSRGAKGKKKKKEEEEVYCICKQNTDGPMIECGECNDWFHFDCVGLNEDEAEKIHKYVCPECEKSTGEKTTHIFDIETFPSPTPPLGIIPAKRKQPRPVKSESESEAVPSSPHSPPPPKRRQPSGDNKRKMSIDRKPSVGGLPPMRKYVREKLAPPIKAMFGTMDDGKAEKTQFNLLHSSINKGLRPSLADSIVDGSLTPAQIAVLTSADLASEEQLAAMERAKQAVLEQHVRAKEDVTSIRLGRDGFEKVEDTHEKEMKLLAAQEEAVRVRAEEARRESLISEVPQSPVVPDVPRMTPKRSDSIDVGSPATQFALKSAWGGERDPEEPSFGGGQEVVFGGDQELDLSDIVQGDIAVDDLLEEKLLDESPGEMESFEAKPVMWSGKVSASNSAELTKRLSIPPIRHAIYLPYGPKAPHGVARELYLIPLRPDDPSPDFTDLIDGYSLPAKGRPTSVFLGVFVMNKYSTPVLAHVPPPPAPIPISATAAAPTIESERLKALMASLNPTTIQSLVGASTPPQGGLTPTAGSSTPMPPPPPNFPPFPPQGHSPYPPPADPYGSTGASYPPRPSDPRHQRQREFGGRERDNGWGSRGGERRH
ncbi:hypothetical protein IAR55_003280 [Kwoniella newhampshirensis]|uniref:PHD-type domain-containing protein n=1 Tax=Kwoniella newhampshirensis TaxID=1651941 RepID=A0AAW0YNB2_9TREE